MTSELITLKTYKERLGYRQDRDISNIQEIECLWDYPLNELDYCKDNNINVVFVQLESEVRLFEI